jgi:hypothetical protein
VAQVLVLVQRVDRRTRGRSLVVDDEFELPAFADEADPFREPEPRSAGRAYITVTDAAGRVLFRRPATRAEVDDAMRSADEATREGEAAMERIAYDRMFRELLGDAE